ncbi:heavy-metal-associated domain-containing protein [bacterium]|nr:heavy-metal-associated domain-containing protein [bacterium]
MSETMTPTEGELHFSVPGMKCGGCAGAIDQVVRRQTGIRDLKIDVATKEVKLSVDP